MNTRTKVTQRQRRPIELTESVQRSNIWRLTLAQALAGANAIVIYATGAIIGMTRPEDLLSEKVCPTLRTNMHETCVDDLAHSFVHVQAQSVSKQSSPILAEVVICSGMRLQTRAIVMHQYQPFRIN